MTVTKLPKIKLASVKSLYNTTIKCPYCGDNRIISKGKSRKQCKNCRHTFAAPGHRKRQHFPKIPGFGG